MKRQAAPYAAPAAAPTRFTVVWLPVGVSRATVKADDIKRDEVLATSEIEVRSRVSARLGYFIEEIVPAGAESAVLTTARARASALPDTPNDLRSGSPAYISGLG